MERLRLALTASGLFGAALACQGCANFTAVDVHDPTRVAAQLQAGGKIRVRDAAGERRKLRVEAVAPDHLLARDANGDEVRIEYADNPSIERRDFAPGKTVALVIGMVILLYEIAYAVGTAELATEL